MTKNYFISILWKFDSKTTTLTPEYVYGGHGNGDGKDLLHLSKYKTAPVLFNTFIKVCYEAYINGTYGKVREMLKDDFGLNIDDCNLEIEINI